MLPDFNSLTDQVQLICSSYRQLLGRALINPRAGTSLAEELFNAPLVVLSHGTESDPVFNFGNRMALELFEMDWEALTSLPSRFSAEAPNREERARLLDRVARFGFIDDYQGVRISSSGKRFLISEATVWNLSDAAGRHCGQAAAFSHWTLL